MRGFLGRFLLALWPINEMKPTDEGQRNPHRRTPELPPAFSSSITPSMPSLPTIAARLLQSLTPTASAVRWEFLVHKFAWIVLACGTIMVGAPAHAQTYDPNYPICMQVVTWGGGEYNECSYTSIAQCAASASGRAAHCIVNPYFAGTQFRGRERRY
jgi:hypothetical protein